MSKSKQPRLFENKKADSGPVTCLGMKFESDEARREYFTEELRKKLQDPEFRAIEGFPIGEDEDILALSDPPYYTACPNPWVKDFIEQWEKDKPTPENDEPYHREPFAADVKEGKNDPIYNAHSYHTKVPHKAIMRYILHYTEPGDIVFDGFCGTGMTGVAAQMCGDRAVVESLGYQVKQDGTILQQETDEEGKTRWVKFSKLGVRKAVLNDLSPAATFIAYNYNTPVDVAEFEEEAKRILAEIEEEYGWMYETRDKSGRVGKINYVIWSDVFVCPECTGDVIFWDAAVDKNAGKVRDKFPCPHCQAELSKRGMERAWVTQYDSALQKTIRQAKHVPVSIKYTVPGNKGRLDKTPDEFDVALIKQIEEWRNPYQFPIDRMMKGKETRRNDRIGITHAHHFYTKRNLYLFSASFSKLPSWGKWVVTGCLQRGSKQHQIAITRIGGPKAGQGGATAGHRRGTLYIPSNQVEMNPINLLRDRFKAVKKALLLGKTGNVVLSTESTSNAVNEKLFESMDYFFFDPPFGANIAYSELNSLQEYWLGVSTEQVHEAIEDSGQGKTLQSYQKLISTCFQQAYKSLKPGKWMTVEFSNTKASVWNVIQTSLQEAGFIISNISSLNKGRGGLNAIVGVTAVKQDLVISAYKPNGGFEERFLSEASSEEGVWDFIRTHLKYLPITKRQGNQLVAIPERDPRILFDQMVSYYVRKGYPVPLSSQEFQIGLSQRFAERDGMVFLPEQVAEYDRKKMTVKELVQASLFVSDEASAIQWLRQLLKSKPQTFSDINPLFMQEISGWKKVEKPLELSTLLKQNFLCYDGKEKVPEQIHAYLSTNWKDMRNLDKEDPTLKTKAKDRWYVPDPNKAGDLEKLRERDLLKEFESYKAVKKFKRNDRFRLEAVRAGFKNAWQAKDYPTIISIAEKIPSKILEEDPKLLMWYDQAVTRNGDV